MFLARFISGLRDFTRHLTSGIFAHDLLIEIWIHSAEACILMVGHSFQNFDTIYVGFLSRILVKISYIWAFIPRIRPFSPHICVQNWRMYAAFKGPYM